MKKKLTGFILMVILLVVVFICGYFKGGSRKEPTVDISAVTAQLEQCSELATAKLHYMGLAKYEEGEIPLISKKSFSMLYAADVRAGIDLSKAEVTVKNDVITVSPPEAEVQSITIDPESLEFYDERIALFNLPKKQDAVEALKQAKKNAEKEISESELLEAAEEQARTVVKTLFAPLTSDAEHPMKLEFAE